MRLNVRLGLLQFRLPSLVLRGAALVRNRAADVLSQPAIAAQKADVYSHHGADEYLRSRVSEQTRSPPGRRPAPKQVGLRGE